MQGVTFKSPAVPLHEDFTSLAGRSNVPAEQKETEACRQFEAVLVRQLLQDACKPVASKALGGAAAGMYHDLTVGQLADTISQSGNLGLARSFEVQLHRSASTSPHPHDD
jgi:Rod binding domain-containing protein